MTEGAVKSRRLGSYESFPAIESQRLNKTLQVGPAPCRGEMGFSFENAGEIDHVRQTDLRRDAVSSAGDLLRRLARGADFTARGFGPSSRRSASDGDPPDSAAGHALRAGPANDCASATAHVRRRDPPGAERVYTHRRRHRRRGAGRRRCGRHAEWGRRDGRRDDGDEQRVDGRGWRNPRRSVPRVWTRDYRAQRQLRHDLRPAASLQQLAVAAPRPRAAYPFSPSFSASPIR